LLRQRRQLAGKRPLAALCAADGDGFDVLRAEHRAAAAAASVTAVVRDGGVAHLPLAGGANHGEAKFRAKSLAQSLLSIATGPPGQTNRRFESDLAFFDD